MSLLIGSFKSKFNQRLSGLLKKKDKDKDKEPRAVRFPVNEAATSNQPPEQMMENLKSGTCSPNYSAVGIHEPKQLILTRFIL